MEIFIGGYLQSMLLEYTKPSGFIKKLPQEADTADVTSAKSDGSDPLSCDDNSKVKQSLVLMEILESFEIM